MQHVERVDGVEPVPIIRVSGEVVSPCRAEAQLSDGGPVGEKAHACPVDDQPNLWRDCLRMGVVSSDLMEGPSGAVGPALCMRCARTTLPP